MGDHFHGWRRKIGMATPLIALVAWCCFATGFLRFGCWYIGERAAYGSVFKGYGLECGRAEIFKESGRSMKSCIGVSGWQPIISCGTPLNVEGRFAEMHVDPKWHLRWCGFHYGQGIFPDLPIAETVVAVPYWPFVVPFAVISAWLLLSNPQATAAPKKITEPPAENVT